MEVAADLASWATICFSRDHNPFKSSVSALFPVALKTRSGRVSTHRLSDQEGGC